MFLPVKFLLDITTFNLTLTNFVDSAASVTFSNTSFAIIYLDLIKLGSTFTFSFKANLTEHVRPQESIISTIGTKWTSTPSISLFPGRVRNETNGWATNSNTFKMQRPTITSKLNRTSLPETTNSPSPRVNIGEEITYEVTFKLPETEMNLQLQVATPSGLVLRGGYVSWIGARISSPILSVLSGMTSLANQFAAFNFSAIANFPDNIVNTNDQIIFIVR